MHENTALYVVQIYFDNNLPDMKFDIKKSYAIN